MVSGAGAPPSAPDGPLQLGADGLPVVAPVGGDAVEHGEDQVLEGPAAGFDLRLATHPRPFSPVTQRLLETWARGVKAMENVLDETTLADLCKPETTALMYYI